MSGQINANRREQFSPGAFGRIVGLVRMRHYNGRYVHVLTLPVENTVRESDGVHRTAVRVGFELVTDPKITGYLRLENIALEDGVLDEVIRRAIWIHEIGSEPPEFQPRVPDGAADSA